MIPLLIGIFIGTSLGVIIMGIFSAGAYHKGWEDAKDEHST